METIFLLISPFIVNLFTQGIKQLHAIKLAPQRVLLVRAVVGVLAFVVTILNVWVNGGEVDQTYIADFVDTTVGTVFIALTSHLIYTYTPQKVKDFVTSLTSKKE